MSERLYRRGDSPNWYAYLGKINGKDVYRSTGCRDRAAAEAKAAKMEREAHQLALGEIEPGDAWYRKPASSYVYFVGGPSGAIKIGRGADPDVRLSRMQTASPVPLKLLAAVPGGPQLEAALHFAFAAGRKEGEWFTPGPRLAAVVREIALALGRPMVLDRAEERRRRRADERAAAKKTRKIVPVEVTGHAQIDPE